MKQRKHITKDIFDILNHQTNKARDELGINFNVAEIYLYGSNLSNKSNPNDIDIFLKVTDVSSEYDDDFQYDPINNDLSKEEQLEYYLVNQLHDFFHGNFVNLNNQPSLNGKKIDINVSSHDFEEYGYSGLHMKLEDFFAKQNLIYGEENHKVKKNDISIFETPIAILKLPIIMEKHVLKNNPWNLKEGQLTEKELSDFMSFNNKRIKVGIYGDSDDFEKSNIDDCSRESHLARIAWLIDNWDESKLDPFEMESSFNEDEFSNGYHRAFAAHYKGIKEVECKYFSGHVNGYEGANILPINQLDSFIKWKKAPTGIGYFGKNIISCGKECYDIQKNEHEGKIWVSDNNGISLARFKNKGSVKVLEYKVKNENKVLTGEDVTIEKLKEILSEISPILNSIDEKYFKGFKQKNKKSSHLKP